MERFQQIKAKATNICSLPYSRKLTYFLAMLLFCLCIGGFSTVSHAYTETKGTVTAASAKIRDKADTSGAVIGSVNANGSVDICGEETGSDGFVWYQVYVNATTKGYIRSDLVQKAGDSSSSATSSSSTSTSSTTTTTTSASSSTSLPETSVTATESKAGKVTTDGVNIRSGAATAYDVVATAKKGLAVTVTGNAKGTDGKTWYQVKFSYNNEEITGFIRSDLVTFGEVESDASTSEITGTVSEEGNTEGEQEMEETEVTTDAVEETTEAATEEQQSEAENAEASTTSSSMDIVLLNTTDEPYVLPEFTQVILNYEGQEINAWKNGDFYLFYAQKDGGQEGWYLYDATEGVYERYVYETENATTPSGSGNTLIFVTFGIIIALLISVIIVMFLKLRVNAGSPWKRHDDDDFGDDDDDFSEEDDEELEEETDDDMEEVRGRRPSQKPEKVPVRGTRMNPNMEQRVRKPIREEEDEEEEIVERPVRRPTNPQGRPMNPQNRPVNPQGRPVNAQGRPVNPQGRPVNPQGRPVNPQGRPVNPQGRPVNAQGRPVNPQGRPVNPDGRPVRRPDGQGQRPVRRMSEEEVAYQGDDRRPAASQNGNVRTRRVQPQVKKESEDIEFIDI